jgi:hypothetical protein
LEAERTVAINKLGLIPVQYSIVPLAGDMIVETYLDDSSLRVYPFAFQSRDYTLEELSRLDSMGFYETLAEWFETQTKSGTLPSLDAGKTVEKIEALQWGYLFQERQTTGVYQVQCRLTYKQASA